jgi:RHS repeat-associated protein
MIGLKRHLQFAEINGAAAPVTTYQYNTDGQETSITDSDGNTTFYQYNSMGEQVSELNAAGSTWTTQYDPNGNVISTTDADGRTIDYTYNKLGEVTSENWVGGDYTITYTYNTQGELTEVSDPDSTTNYTYNSSGQLTTTTNDGTPSATDVTLNTTYNLFDELAGLDGVIGSTTEFTNSYGYDPDGNMTDVSQSGSAVTSKEASFTYNGDGQFTGMTLAAGGDTVATASYGYDDANRLTSLTYMHGDTTIESYGYTYDANNWVTQLTDNDGTTSYTYNNDGELTGASGSGLPSSNSYTYDSNGNRTSTDGASESTGTNNQLSSDGTYDYTYDGDGNLITQTTISTGATENFTWDYRNRLTEIVYKNSSGVVTGSVQYTYDAANQRISQIVKNGSGTVTLNEQYVYDPTGNLVMTLDGSGNVTHTFLTGPLGQTLADDAGSSNVTWLLADQQGSVRDVINDSGTVIDHIVYDPYGNILSQTDSDNQPRFVFDGMQLDSATGLYYDNARYYDSASGTFISQDPIGFADGGTDMYAFVGNDPVNLIDLTGERGGFAGTSAANKLTLADVYPLFMGGGGGGGSAAPISLDDLLNLMSLDPLSAFASPPTTSPDSCSDSGSDSGSDPEDIEWPQFQAGGPEIGPEASYDVDWSNIMINPAAYAAQSATTPQPTGQSSSVSPPGQNYVTEAELYYPPGQTPPPQEDIFDDVANILDDVGYILRHPQADSNLPDTISGPAPQFIIGLDDNNPTLPSQSDSNIPSVSAVSPEQIAWINSSNGQEQQSLLLTSLSRELLPDEDNKLQILNIQQEGGSTLSQLFTTGGNSSEIFHDALEDWALGQQDSNEANIPYFPPSNTTQVDK